MRFGTWVLFFTLCGLCFRLCARLETANIFMKGIKTLLI